MQEISTNLFPVVDLTYLTSAYGQSEYKIIPVTDPKIKELSHKLFDAFSKWGFVYLVNHGINEEDIENSFEQSRQFFELDKSVREEFLLKSNGEYWGYVPVNTERYEKSRPYDFKESFNFKPKNIRHRITDILPNFMKIGKTFYNSCQSLSMKLLYLLNMHLTVTDPYFLTNQHKHISDVSKNATISRLLYYPPVIKKDDMMTNHLRCSEHSDYGSITLLFQDNCGGLQVINPSGEYVNVPPIPGSVIVNTGDLLEIWSSGKLKSTRHRVVVPDNCRQARQSIVFFCYPDSDTTVECLDGSNKYESQNPIEYLIKKFAEIY